MFSYTYRIRHQGRHGPADLVGVQVHVGGRGEQDEDEPDREAHLGGSR